MKTSSIFISALEDLYNSLVSPYLSNYLDNESLILLSKWNFSNIIQKSTSQYVIPFRKIIYFNDPCIQNWNGILCRCSKYECKIWSIDVTVRHKTLLITNTTTGLGNYYSSIPSTINYFIDLEFLSIHSDTLYGSIPDEFGLLTSLKYLNLSGNNLSGFLLEKISLFNNLSSLYLNDNLFSGTIPIQYYNIGKYVTEPISIDFSNNLLNGSLPIEIFNITYLTSIHLSNNQFTGTLKFKENSISSYLKDIILHSNLLSGTISDFILNNTNLCNIVLSNNLFSGSIPSDISPIHSSIQYIDFRRNILVNSIPSSLSTLTSLVSLNLGFNKLTGIIPLELKYLNKSLRSLDLSNNLFTSTISSELGQLFRLEITNATILSYMNLNNNFLTGIIPSSLGYMSNINYLDLNTNLLIGSVPNDLNKLLNLKELYLQNNLLTGKITNFINPLNQIYFNTLDISSNYFTGTISSSLFSMPSLRRLIASQNCISGPLPNEICNANNLTVLMLSGLSSASTCTNTINSKYIKVSLYTLKFALGSIPKCVYSLPNLSILEISGNQISEKITDDLIFGSKLNQLRLSYNQYSGSISNQIQNRPWKMLDVSSNKIGGVLSENSLKIGINSSLYLDMNRLSGFIPKSLKNISSISILNGNMFQCDYFHSSLPKYDFKMYSYSCGSEYIDYIIYSWITLAVMVSMFVYFISRLSPPKKIEKKLRFMRKSKVSLKSLCLDFFSKYKLEFDQSMANYEEELSALPERQNRYIIMTGRSLSRLRTLFMWLILYLIILVLPIYCILNVFYRNYSQMYIWTVSAIHLSGLYPGIMIFLISAATLSLVLFLYNIYIFKPDVFLIAVDSDGPKEKIKLNSNETYCHQFLKILSYLLISLINMILMLAANILFVYGTIHLSRYLSIILEFVIVVFTLFWNDKGLGSLIQCLIKGKYINQQKSRQEMFYLFHVLYNVIIAPSLAVGIVSDECLYYGIFSYPTISSSYTVSHPIYDFKGRQIIYENSLIILNQAYIPPFSYNFQCGSAIVTTYCPVFVFMFIVSIFGVSLRDFIVKSIYNCIPEKYGWKVYLEYMLPNIKKPLHLLVTGESFVNSDLIIFDKYKFSRTISCFVTILITFGTIFPLLGIIAMVSIFIKINFEQWTIGKFLNLADKENLYMHRNILDYQCKDLIETFNKSLYIIFPVSSIFYVLLIYDTIASSTDPNMALPVVILMFITPFVLCVISILKTMCLPNYAKVYAESQAQLLKVQLTYQLNLEYTPQSNVDATAVMLKARNNQYSYHSTSLILEEFENQNDDLSLCSSQTKSIYSIKRKPDLIDFEHYVN